MKRITIELTDDGWKKLRDTLRHEFGEPLSEEIENIVKKEVAKFIHDTYIRGIGV